MTKQRTFAVADCETDPFLHGRIPTPFIWGLYDGTIYKEFSDTASFVEYVADQEIDVYAHNGGKFDWHFILDYIARGSEVKVIAGRLAQLRLGKAKLLDSYSLLPTPLAAFNKQEFDYTKLESDNRRFHMPEIRAYLKSDCVNLYRYLEAYFAEYPRALTLAGAAFKVWKSMSGVKVPKTGIGLYEKFKPYYFGGRVECFETGILNGPFKIIDINSAYPRAMLEPHPWGKNFETSNTLPAVDKWGMCFIHVTGHSLGAFPVRDEKTGGVSFPHGCGEFYVTGHEFAAALETGTFSPDRIIAVHRFTASINFADYVNHFYKKKLAAEASGDTTGRLFAKLFMNSLYGKFASNPQQYRDYIIDDWGKMDYEMERDGWTAGDVIGESQLYSRPLDEDDMHFYNLATGASITGWVRAFLWRSINAVERPLYCDTDSIVCAATGNLRLSDALGDWGVDGVADQIAIAGKKLYAARLDDGTTKTASKGARLDAEEIERVAAGDVVTYRSEAPTFSIARGHHFVIRNIQSTESH